jgi:hypothetical protein
MPGSGVVPARPRQYFADLSGLHPNAGGSVEVYMAGTLDPVDSFQDKALTILNPWPVPLDSRGQCLLWLSPLYTYKLIVKDSLGRTVDTDDDVLVGGNTPVSTKITVDRFSGTGAETNFPLSVTPSSENETMVFVGNSYVQKNAYSLLDNVLIFAVAPASGTNNIEVQTTQSVEFAATADLITQQAQQAADAAEAAALSETNAGTSETNAIVAANEASVSEVNAAASASAAAAAGLTVVYATVAAGVAATSAGQHFDVAPVAGQFHYRYLRSGASDAIFAGMVAITPAAQTTRDYLLAAKSSLMVRPLPAAVTHFWDAASAKKWDLRTVANVVAATDPTLNAVPDAFVMINENATNTPARTGFDATIVDPLGGHQAMVLSYTAQLQPLNFSLNSSVTGLPSDTYTERVSFKQADASTGTLRLGNVNNAAGATTLASSSSWLTLTNTNAAYTTASFGLGITNSVGGGAWNVAVFNLQMYDSKAGTILPTDAQEQAASAASHLKPPLAYPGAVKTDTYGWIKLDGTGGIDNLVAAFPQLAVSEMTIGGAVDVTTYTGPTFANLISVATQIQSGVSGSTKGQIGFDSSFRLYCNPALATAGRSTDVLQNQGPVSLMLRCKPGQVTAYINGVPVFDDTTSSGAVNWTAFVLERLMIGANSASQRRDQTSNKVVDPMHGLFFAPKFLTDAEISAVHRSMCDRARMGTSKPMGLHKILAVGCGDSLTGFPEAPFYQMNPSALLKPGVHTSLDAVGGSKYVAGALAGSNSYNDPTRQALRRRMLVQGLAAGYALVVAHWQYAHNDISGGVMDAPNTIDQGVAIVDAMIFGDKAACDDGTGRLKTCLVTNPWDASATPDRIARLTEYNTRSVTPGDSLYYLTRGYDYVIPLHQYVPAGWASLQAASEAAAGGNDVYLPGGLHWSATGGLNAANAVFVPFYQALAATVVGAV